MDNNNQFHQNDPYEPYPNEPQVPVNGPSGNNQKPEKPKSRMGIGIMIGVLITLAAVMVAAVCGAFFLARNIGFFGGSAAEMDYEEKIETIRTYLNEYYLGELDDEALEDGLAEGLLKATGDKYAEYYSKKQFEMMMDEKAGSYSGIGVSVIENNNGDFLIYVVFEESPAAEAGLQVRDEIISVDGVTDIETIDDLVDLVRGEAGTTVDLVVRRGEEEISVTVERRVINMQTVNYEMLDDEIGYIEILEFDEISVGQFNEALDALTEQGMKSLILDVRDNPGGDYDTVMAMADRVLPEGTITTVINNKGIEKTETSDAEHQLTLPIVLLINENSASAAELFSCAIKDYGIATLVGETTYGKGIIQSIFRLPDGSGMKFTTEEYLTPKGNHINEIGVSPDIEVAIPEEAYEDGIVTKEEDTQFQTAVDLLKNGKEAAINK